MFPCEVGGAPSQGHAPQLEQEIAIEEDAHPSNRGLLCRIALVEADADVVSDVTGRGEEADWCAIDGCPNASEFFES